MPSQISVGESFPFAGNYTYEAGTGTGSITNGSVTIDGIEIVEDRRRYFRDSQSDNFQRL